MRILKNLIFGVLLVIGGVMLMMLIPSPQAPAEKPWEVTIMPDGNSKVLGIHLGSTDYKSAQEQLGIFGKTALFVDPDGRQGVEAYFDSVNLGGLSAKLVLNLDVQKEQLGSMLSRAIASERKPSGAHQYELAEADRVQLLTVPVIAITYIPSVTLKPDMVISRFGEPEGITQTPADEDGLSGEIWRYPALGLSVVFQSEQKTVLIYRAKS